MSDGSTSLPPDSAARVLGADLRNTVAKVAAGDRLPEADRSRLETTVLTDADPETVARLAKERQANLLKIWSSGRRRLTPAELQEIEHILPLEVLARPPTKKTIREYSVAHYAEIYGVAERTIKHWNSIGRKAQPGPDLPPLEDPPRMKEWYARNNKNRVPDRLVQLAAQAARLDAGETVAAPCGHVTTTPPAAATSCGNVTTSTAPAESSCGIDTTKEPPPAGASATPPAKPAAARGFEATLERLRIAEAAEGEKYTRFIMEGKDDEAAAAERRWQKLRSDLRAYEKDAQEVLSSQGKLWPADEVTAALYEIHTVIIQTFESLYSRIETELRTLPREEAKRLYLAECHRIRGSLVANKFTAPPVLAA